MTIQSFVGIGPIKFGMSPGEVRQILGVAHQSFMKTPSSSFPTDAFDSLGLHVYYDKEGKCEAVEVFRPGKATYGGLDLLSLKYVDVEGVFSRSDTEMEVHDAGFNALRSGVSVFSPDKEEDKNASCESILVFKEGYWSS